MSETLFEGFFVLDIVVFLAAVFMHLVKHSRSLVRLYALQSFAVAGVLFLTGFLESDTSLMVIGVITAIIKALVAPLFFRSVTRTLAGVGSATNYLNTPLTLFVLTGLVLFSFSKVFLPLSALYPQAFVSVPLNIAIIFISIFLLINRRGVFTQMVGMLSLENGIVIFAALFSSLHPLPLEIGTLFDLILWILIASIFIRMIYRQFGTLSTVDMKRLTE